MAGGVHGVLIVERRYDIADGNAQTRQGVGPHPEAHRVLVRAEDCYLADTRHAAHRIVDVDVRVVGEESAVVGSLRRVEREQRQRASGRLEDGHPLVADVDRELRLGLEVAHLREDLVSVCVCPDVEVHPQPHQPAARVDRGHVDHVVDTLKLLLDRRCDRFLESQRIGTDIGGVK